jgi:AbrB family looped-hinge helix DNA binding protein
MRINSKGAVTIPRRIRERAGLRPGVAVEIVFNGESVQILRAPQRRRRRRGSNLIEQLHGRGDVRLSTDEIMALTRDSK